MAWGRQATCLHQNCKLEAHCGSIAFSWQGTASMYYFERAGRGHGLTKTGPWVREVECGWDSCCAECPCIHKQDNSFAFTATVSLIRSAQPGGQADSSMNLEVGGSSPVVFSLCI